MLGKAIDQRRIESCVDDKGDREIGRNACKDRLKRSRRMSAVKYHTGKFPPQRLDLERLLPLVGPASSAVARYDGVLSAIPNASVLLSPLTTQEAVLSSKIEGTQATMGEVLEFEAEGGRKKIPEEKREDINEILNYRKAMRHAETRLQELQRCQRVDQDVHGVLMITRQIGTDLPFLDHWTLIIRY